MDWTKLLSAKRVGQFKGKSASKDDSRTPFERDYGRAVFCTPVRRLQDKTQVFPLEEHDAVRTRLTHSLEVSSLARNLGRQAGEWIENEKKGLTPRQINDVETIAATCGLIHDLGNPPFGHAGESAIQSWFQKQLQSEKHLEKFGGLDPTNKLFKGFPNPDKGETGESQFAADFLNWEGNAQTLRLVSRLQVLADNSGINLTCATFSAARKYLAQSNQTGKDGYHENSKPGFFASETETVLSVADETGTQLARHPITYLVEASDDIVYSTGDLEDGIRKGLHDWEFVKTELLRFSNDDDLVKRAIKEAEDTVHFDPKERPRVRNEEVAQAFRTHAIGYMKEAAFKRFRECYDDLMDGKYHKELIKDSSCDAAAFVDACKRVGQEYIYPSGSTLKLELMGRKVIHDLMDIFWEGASICGAPRPPKDCKKGFAGKAFSLISSNYRQVFSDTLIEDRLPEQYCRLQLVTDQIAGMTDSFAITLHKRLMNG